VGRPRASARRPCREFDKAGGAARRLRSHAEMVATFGLPDMGGGSGRRASRKKWPDRKKDREQGAIGGGWDPAFGNDPGDRGFAAPHCPGIPDCSFSAGFDRPFAGGRDLWAARAEIEQKLRFAQAASSRWRRSARGPMTEPGRPASDAFRVDAVPWPRRDGDHYVLNGEKTFITNAPLRRICSSSTAKLDDGRERPRIAA